MRTLSLDGMTLRTARLEEIGTLLIVTRSVRHFERYLCSQAKLKTEEQVKSGAQLYNFCTQPRVFSGLTRPIASLGFARIYSAYVYPCILYKMYNNN